MLNEITSDKDFAKLIGELDEREEIELCLSVNRLIINSDLLFIFCSLIGFIKKNFSKVYIRCSFIWSLNFFNLFVSLLIDAVLWSFDRTDMVQKWTSRARISTWLSLKSISFLKNEWFSFGPESRVQATDKDSDLRLKMTATQRQMMEVQLQGRIKTSNIFFLKSHQNYYHQRKESTQ